VDCGKRDASTGACAEARVSILRRRTATVGGVSGSIPPFRRRPFDPSPDSGIKIARKRFGRGDLASSAFQGSLFSNAFVEGGITGLTDWSALGDAYILKLHGTLQAYGDFRFDFALSLNSFGRLRFLRVEVIFLALRRVVMNRLPSRMCVYPLKWVSATSMSLRRNWHDGGSCGKARAPSVSLQ
jgi:hypothetical protein